MTTQTEALKALIHEMEYVLSCINQDKIPFDGDDFHEALRLGKEALAQPEQEPYCWTWDEWIGGGRWRAEYGWEKPERQVTNLQPLYTTPPQRKEPEQKPVAWGNFKEDGTLVGLSQHPEDQSNWTGRKPLYTTPPQRTWVGLAPEDMPDGNNPMFDTDEFALGAAWAQAKLKEKNT